MSACSGMLRDKSAGGVAVYMMQARRSFGMAAGSVISILLEDSLVTKV